MYAVDVVVRVYNHFIIAPRARFCSRYAVVVYLPNCQPAYSLAYYRIAFPDNFVFSRSLSTRVVFGTEIK